MGVLIQPPGDPGHPGGNRRTYVRVNFRGHRKTRVFNSAKAAEAYAAQVEAHLKLGKVEEVFASQAAPIHQAPATPPATFAQAAERYKAVDGATWKAGTTETYTNMLDKHILSAFGSRPLSDITRADIEAWWAVLRGKGYSHIHLSKIRVVLDGVFKRAVASDLTDRNPVDAIRGRLGREDREVRQAEWLTEAELAKVLAVAKEREPRHFPFFLLLATGGLRFGEAHGLQVPDVDAAGCRLHIRRGLRKHRVASPKSAKARTVYLPHSTVAVLRDWMQIIRAEAAVRGEEPRWLFPGATGTPADEAPIRTAFQRCLKAAGITRHIRPHDLRHPYASLAIQRGVPLLKVSRQLGHASVSITFDVYGHLAPDAGQEVAEAWEAILTAPTRNPSATAAPEFAYLPEKTASRVNAYFPADAGLPRADADSMGSAPARQPGR